MPFVDAADQVVGAQVVDAGCSDTLAIRWIGT